MYTLYHCGKCDYKSSNMNVLKNHSFKVHGSFIHETKREMKCPPPPWDLNNINHSTECCDKRPGAAKPRIYTKFERMENGICIEWNKGYCEQEDLCSKNHVEIPECRFGTFCTRDDCHFWHSFEGKFPFLGGCQI